MFKLAASFFNRVNSNGTLITSISKYLDFTRCTCTSLSESLEAYVALRFVWRGFRGDVETVWLKVYQEKTLLIKNIYLISTILGRYVRQNFVVSLFLRYFQKRRNTVLISMTVHLTSSCNVGVACVIIFNPFYEGWLFQVFTKALVPKPIADGANKNVPPEMEEAEIKLTELLIELPKVHVRCVVL